MSNYKTGSARRDENGKYVNGKSGDQTGHEVEYGPWDEARSWYKNWVVIRVIEDSVRRCIGDAMINICDENHGYDQNDRWAGTGGGTTGDLDCATSVWEAFRRSGITLTKSNFTTGNIPSICRAYGGMEIHNYVDGEKLYHGDVLCTATKGHVEVCVYGEDDITSTPASTTSSSGDYYPIYNGNSSSIIDSLKAVGETDTSLAHSLGSAFLIRKIGTLLAYTEDTKLGGDALSL